MPERFSWILPDKLAVGSFPYQTTSVSRLRRERVTAVLCLTEEGERSIPSQVRHSFVWEQVGIPDGFTGGVPTEQQFDRAIQILNRWYRKKHAVYVHCLAGVGRSASVCSLYVAQDQGLALADAIAYVKERHAFANPDSKQIEVMQRYLASVTTNESS